MSIEILQNWLEEEEPPPDWLAGWQYRKSHVINPATGAGTNYQVKIKALYVGDETKVETIVPFAKVVSMLPIPSGRSILSGQAAIYWDGTYLHAWYGATTGGEANDDIFYTKATSSFTSWDTPVKVIDRADGIRDPISIVVGDYIYFFCQCYDGSYHRPIRLYKIAKAADFTNSANYVYVGAPIDVGSSGQFDDRWVASACVVKIGSTYWMAYEALKADNTFSIGRAYSSDIEGSWTKDGQMRDSEGDVIYAPAGNTRAIVPCTFADADTLFIHHNTAANEWKLRYMSDDIPNNSMTLSSSDIKPDDAYTQYVGFAHVGFINGGYTFLLSQPSSPPRLYQTGAEVVFINGHCRTDFGDIRFTDDDKATLLDYWMESKVDSDNAVFWVEVTDSLESVAQTIYIYYGKADATTTSNGDTTFIFGDNFSGPSLDTSKWAELGTGTIIFSDGYIRIKTTSSWGEKRIKELADRDLTNRRIIQRWRIVTNAEEAFTAYYLIADGGTRTWQALWDNTNLRLQLYTRLSGAWGNRWSGGATELNVWYKQHLLVKSSSIKVDCFNDDYSTRENSGFQNYDAAIRRLMLRVGQLNGECDWDYCWIAKYVDPEPSHGAWGSEEEAGGVAVGLTRTLPYHLRILVMNTESLTYHTRNLAGNTDTFQYHVRSLAGRTRSLLYNVRNLAGKTNSLLYHVRNLLGRLNTLVYHVRGLTGKTNTLKYHLRNLAGNAETWIYHVYGKIVVGLTRSLVYNVRNTVGNTDSLQYHVRGLIGKTRSLLYNVRGLAGRSRSLVYHVRNLAGKTRSLVYDVRVAVGRTRTLFYHVRSLISNSETLKYSVRVLAGRSRSLLYHVRSLAGKTNAFLYNVRSLAGKTNALKYHVRNLAGNTETWIYHVYGKLVVGLSNSLVYHVRGLTGNTESLRYHVRGLMGRSRGLVYHVRGLTGKTQTFKYHVYGLVGRSRRLVYHVALKPWAGAVMTLTLTTRELAVGLVKRGMNLVLKKRKMEVEMEK